MYQLKYSVLSQQLTTWAAFFVPKPKNCCNFVAFFTIYAMKKDCSNEPLQQAIIAAIQCAIHDYFLFVKQRPRSREIGMINPIQIVCAIIDALAKEFKEMMESNNPRENAYHTSQTTKIQYCRDKNRLFE